MSLKFKIHNKESEAVNLLVNDSKPIELFDTVLIMSTDEKYNNEFIMVGDTGLMAVQIAVMMKRDETFKTVILAAVSINDKLEIIDKANKN